MLQSFPLVRLAALDLDGTLLNRNNEVTLATRQAIARAVEHGVVVVPATGRPLASLPPVVAKLPGIRYAITSNGAAVWDLGDDPMGAVHSRYANAAQRHTSEPACLLHRLMPTEVAREAFDLFQQYDGELSVFSDGLAIKTPEGIAKLTSRTARFLSSEARQNLTDGRFTVIPGIESWMSRHAHEIEKLCMFFDSTEKTAAALPKFQAIPGVAVVQGSPDNIEVPLPVWIRAVPCWLWPTCWASPTRTPLPWATARTTAPCWKRQGSPLLWPTECPRSRPLAAL